MDSLAAAAPRLKASRMIQTCGHGLSLNAATVTASTRPTAPTTINARFAVLRIALALDHQFARDGFIRRVDAEKVNTARERARARVPSVE